MSFKQKIHTFNGALKGDRNYPANAVISPDQRYLYVANRGQNSIAQFSIKANGELIYIKEKLYLSLHYVNEKIKITSCFCIILFN